MLPAACPCGPQHLPTVPSVALISPARGPVIAGGCSGAGVMGSTPTDEGSHLRGKISLGDSRKLVWWQSEPEPRPATSVTHCFQTLSETRVLPGQNSRLRSSFRGVHGHALLRPPYPPHRGVQTSLHLHNSRFILA